MCNRRMPTIDPRGETARRDAGCWNFGTRYGPIRTRGAGGHGVMPGAGTFLRRVDQSERAIFFFNFHPRGVGVLGRWDGSLSFFLGKCNNAATPCFPVCVRGVYPDRVNTMDIRGDV